MPHHFLFLYNSFISPLFTPFYHHIYILSLDPSEPAAGSTTFVSLIDTIMNLNSSAPSPFPLHQITYDNDHHHYHPFPTNPNSLSCRIFFNSSQDQTAFYDPHQLFHPQDDNYGYEMKRKVESGLKLTLWKKEDEGQNGNFPVKWMSSKMRLMQKMKNPSDQKLQPSSSDTSSNSSSYNNNNNNNNNAPIRVCADCNTTKTPLWRSGPKGPKSLCNACGIRQRKARRAMAAAAAAASGSADHQPPVMKIKVQHKADKAAGKNGPAQLKKRCKAALAASGGVGSPSKGKKKIDFEDFLINISKNLAFQRVFPEDEKDAAILLMALSSGLVNGR